MEAPNTLWILEPGTGKPVHLVVPRVGLGSIEIVRTETHRDTKVVLKRQRFDLVITELPASGNSLIATFVEDLRNHPSLLKADLWGQQQIVQPRTKRHGRGTRNLRW
jgi:hypothetical protein